MGNLWGEKVVGKKEAVRTAILLRCSLYLGAVASTAHCEVELGPWRIEKETVAGAPNSKRIEKRCCGVPKFQFSLLGCRQDTTFYCILQLIIAMLGAGTIHFTN